MHVVHVSLVRTLDAKRAYVRLLRAYGATAMQEAILYKENESSWATPWLAVTEHHVDADVIIAPQPFRSPQEGLGDAAVKLRDIAVEYGKPVVAFAGTDLSHRIHVKGVWLFMASMYKRLKKDNEIALVPYIADMGEGKEVLIRKKSAKPVVGFCGYAGFPNTKTKVRYWVKNFLLDALAFITRDAHHLVYKRGIYFRRWAMEVLGRDARVQTNFIVRDSFGGNVATTKVDPARAREEYIQNMLDSDFVLAPKGDGNYSARFYEALSLGRIPILIDTDMALPLEDTLDYSKFILRVPHTEVHRLGEIVHDYYATLTDESFAEMQRAARKAFAEHLRYDRFFAEVLPTLKGKMPPASL